MANIFITVITFVLTILLCTFGRDCYSLPQKEPTALALVSRYSNNGHLPTVCNPKNYDCNKFDQEILNYIAKLEPFFEKVMSHQPLSVDEAQVTTKIVKEYYTFLINHNIVYAKLARDIVNNNGFFGQIANIHLKHRTKVEGHANQMRNIEINLRVTLAYRDVKLRSECKNFVSYRAIANYHYEMFEYQGLSKYAWGGTLLEEFAGSGSWMHLGDYDNTIPFSPTKLVTAIIKNKKVNDVKARVAFDSVKHIFLEDLGQSLRAAVCGSRPVLCKL